MQRRAITDRGDFKRGRRYEFKAERREAGWYFVCVQNGIAFMANDLVFFDNAFKKIEV